MESDEAYVQGDLDFGSDYFDNSLYDGIGKGKEPLQFTLNDVDVIDLNPIIDEPKPIGNKSKDCASKSPIIPKNVLSKSKSSKSPVVSSSLFRDCMSIQNNNNEYFNDEIDALKRKVDELFKIKQSLQKRIYILETIVVDQSKDIKHFKEKIKYFKDKFKHNDHYLKDTFDKINKNNYILGKLIQGNSDMINHKFFNIVSTYTKESTDDDSNSKKSLKRKYNKDSYKKIREDILEKQRREIAQKEKTRKETAKLSEKISKELEDNDDDCVRASKRLKVKKIVQERVGGK